MKLKTLFLMHCICALTIFSTSCSSNNDNNDDPDGTITINMLNEDNGKTILANSDVYIDDANNFHGNNSSISSLGKKKGLSQISNPVLHSINDKVAVEPGNAYQIFINEAIKEFKSGRLAINIDSDYYNVYVESDIIKNEEVAGAIVKFVYMDVPDQGLPQNNSKIGKLNYNDDELIIDLPTADFEYEFYSDYNVFEHNKDGKKLIVTLSEYEQKYIFEIYIRIKESYTRVYGYVE